jgi:5'-3' exonuclease
MGIQFLNKILQDNCDQSIWHINLSELNGKKIAVDISIYLYKFEAEDALMENMYLMLAIFRHYNILPIFIFDGKPPPEKKELLQKRRNNKMEAKNEYNRLKEQLLNDTSESKQDILTTMDQLKKQFIHITREKNEKVKALIRAFGATYYDAPNEADELCAMLVIKKKVWACLSEDMDLFVYGCSRVLRYISLTNHTVVLYYMKGILNQLDMSLKEFREVCILSGTDYNINMNTNLSTRGKKCEPMNNLYNVMKLFQKYKEYKNKEDNIKQKNTFYKWILNSENYSEYITDLDLLHKINNMFEIHSELVNSFQNIKIINGNIQKEDIQRIMKEDGFMFVN